MKRSDCSILWGSSCDEVLRLHMQTDMNQGFCHQLVQIVKAAGSFAAQLVDVLQYWSKIG